MPHNIDVPEEWRPARHPPGLIPHRPKPTPLQYVQRFLMFGSLVLVIWALCYVIFPVAMDSLGDGIANGFGHNDIPDDSGYVGTPWAPPKSNSRRK